MIEQVIYFLGMGASIILPLFNLPLMFRVYQRKSSQDISLIWAFGIFGCLLLMVPTALLSSDPVFKVFGVLNFSFFAGVFVMVVYYRVKGKKNGN